MDADRNSDIISELAIERLRIITSEKIDLPAMIEIERRLEESGMVACAADMRKRIKHYQRQMKEATK